MPVKRTKKSIARMPAKKARVSRRTVRPSVVTHSFERKTNLFTISGNAVHAPYLGVSNIQLGFVRNAAEFSALYDQYRINKVKIQFWLKVDPSAQTAATAAHPKLYWVRDLDDSNVLTQDEMRERAKCKIAVMRTDRPITIWIKPNLLNLVYRGPTTSSYVPTFGHFLDMTNQDVPHYGIKYNIDDLTNTNYRVDIETTYYFQCKNTR